MNEDWGVGDLALCIDDGPCGCCGEEVPIIDGRIYKVDGLRDASDEGAGLMLILEGVKQSFTHKPGINAARFRKIRPKHEPASREFIESIKGKVPQHV